ncbi:uncharacterized protein TrAFT101_003149 [Trichoderma asperellum]|uniref:uncharacterized protein n=1 Tax=Trichoderma asperellum TaxID=101201 RepID=UPI0033307CD7|nr:hypothetical protein TrAFT101_003149 [Trichoderma asperellum]
MLTVIPAHLPTTGPAAASSKCIKSRPCHGPAIHARPNAKFQGRGREKWGKRLLFAATVEAKLSRAMIPDRQTHGGLRRSTVIWSASPLLIFWSPLSQLGQPWQIYLERRTGCVRFNGGQREKSGKYGTASSK